MKQNQASLSNSFFTLIPVSFHSRGNTSGAELLSFIDDENPVYLDLYLDGMGGKKAESINVGMLFDSGEWRLVDNRIDLQQQKGHDGCTTRANKWRKSAFVASISSNCRCNGCIVILSATSASLSHIVNRN